MALKFLLVEWSPNVGYRNGSVMNGHDEILLLHF